MRRMAAAAAVVLLPAALSGCATAVGVEPAPDAAAPLCAQVYTALPDAVADLARRDTTAQGAAAWVGSGGEQVVLRCGVAQPELSPDCQEITGDGVTVDWIYQAARDGRVTWTTYGRSPAVALEMPADRAVTLNAPIDVGSAVAQVPQQRSCT